MNWRMLGLAVLAGIVASASIWATFALPMPLRLATVAAGALAAEGFAGRLPPRDAVPDPVQNHHGAGTVPAVGLAPVGERGGQPVLVDRAVFAQLGRDRAGHVCVVGPLPGAGRWASGRQFGQ